MIPDEVANLRPLKQATEYAYAIRRLYRSGDMNSTAALTTLTLLRMHPHAGVRRLCETIANRILADIGAPPLSVGVAR